MTDQCFIDICDQKKNFHKNLSQQRPHLFGVIVYYKLKLRATTLYAKTPCPICRQIIQVINMTENEVCNISKKLMFASNKGNGERMLV